MTTSKTNKDGWEICTDNVGHQYAKNGIYTISKCLVGDETKYVQWEGKELKGVYDTFEQAKPKKLRTDKDWLRLGAVLGIAPEAGKGWAIFKARILERID